MNVSSSRLALRWSRKNRLCLQLCGVLAQGILCWLIVAPMASAVLPDGRGYELVSGRSGIGDVLRVPAISPDGNSAAYASLQGGAGATSVLWLDVSAATRSATGWRSVAANPRVPEAEDGFLSAQVVQFASDFQSYLLGTGVALDPGDQDQYRSDIYRVHLDGSPPELLTGPSVLPSTSQGGIQILGATADVRRIVFRDESESLTAEGADPAIYLSDKSGKEVVSVLPDNTLAAYPVPAAYPQEWQFTFFPIYFGAAQPFGGRHAVSLDASRIYFYDSSPPSALYERDTKTQTTVAVSASQRAGDTGTVRSARFIAASPDGDVAYFESAEQLTDDAGVGGGIYRYEGASHTLQLLTPGVTDPYGLRIGDFGAGSAIVSDDGTHLYFTSPVALTPGAGSTGLNAYGWSGGSLRLIASGLDSNAAFMRVSRDGGFALLQAATAIGGASVAGHTSIYEYDDSHHTIACVSCRTDGGPAAGDAAVGIEISGAVPNEMPARALTNDGRVFFDTTDQLVPADANQAADVYEYNHGTTSLLTPGRGDDAAYVADNTDDGSDVFVLTRDRLTAADNDAREYDLYDLRVGGGDPSPPASPDPCREDACQGTGPAPTRLPAAGSMTATTPGNSTAGGRSGRFVRLRHLTSGQLRQFARFGRVNLRAVVRGTGTVRLIARAALRGRQVTVGSSRRAVAGASAINVSLPLTLTSTARRALARNHRLTLWIEVSLSGATSRSRITVTLTRARR